MPGGGNTVKDFVFVALARLAFESSYSSFGTFMVRRRT